MTQQIRRLSLMFRLKYNLYIILIAFFCCGCKTAKINMTSNYLQYSIIIPPGAETHFYSYERQKRQIHYYNDERVDLLIDDSVITICRACVHISPDISTPDSVTHYLLKHPEYFRYQIIRKNDGFYYYANYDGLEHEYKLYWKDTLSHPRFDPQNPGVKPEHSGSFTKYTGRDTVIWTNGVRFNCSIIYEYVVRDTVRYPLKWYVYIDKRTGIIVMIKRYVPIKGIEKPFIMLLTDFNTVK